MCDLSNKSRGVFVFHRRWNMVHAVDICSQCGMLFFFSLLFLQNKRSPSARCADEMFVVYLFFVSLLFRARSKANQHRPTGTVHISTHYSRAWYSIAYYCVWKKNILFMVNIACMICVLCVLFSSTATTKEPYEFTCAADFSHRPAIWAFFTD